jgi:biotin synthase
MSDEMQAMTFFAGANSVFYGECLLTTANPETNKDLLLFKRLGLNLEQGISEDDQTQSAMLIKDIQAEQDSALFYQA